MGMSASQARLLSLQARQSNLEYQGQQINQERTILSQQCTALYNSLLAMKVPTPPSTNDFTTVQYAGVDGASKFTLGTIKPDGDSYIVERQINAHGHSLSKNFGTSVVGKAGENVRGKTISHLTEAKPTGNYKIDDDTENGKNYNDGDIYYETEPIYGSKLLEEKANPSDYMVDLGEQNYQEASSFDPSKTYYKKVKKEDYDNRDDKNKIGLLEPEMTEPEGIPIENLDGYYLLKEGKLTPLTEANVEKNKDGTYTMRALPEGTELFHAESGTDTVEYTNPSAGATTIQGKDALNFDDAKAQYKDVDWGGFEEAIRNSFGGEYDKNDFYVFVTTSETGKPVIQFALKSDVNSHDGFTDTFSYEPNGEFKESKMEKNCKLEFDVDGRITKMGIPTYDADGKPVSYQYIALTASTVTDEKAYQDAYNQYEYAQYEYDKKNKEINAKTEIIQQEDRNLELKLQRLDNERTQIKTEMEAVSKVINDNIEKSYKTFNG